MIEKIKKETIESENNQVSSDNDTMLKQSEHVKSDAFSILEWEWIENEKNIIDLWDWLEIEKFIPKAVKNVNWSIKWKRNNWEIIIYFENNLWWKIEPQIEKMYRLENPLAVDKKDFAILQDYVKKWNSKYKKEFYDKLHEFKEIEDEYFQLKENWENSDGFNEIEKKYEKANAEFEDIKSKSYLARMFYKLPKSWINTRPNIPWITKNTVIWPTTRIFLREFLELSNIQIKSQWAWSWIIIVEWDAWTWKNFKLSLFGHLANREVFEMQWNKTAQKEDILYSYELWPDWTYRLPSHLIKWITTPWSIIVFDEINTYPPEVLKLLNPLLDWRRYINDPQMWKISVANDVIVTWLMNPGHYIWTSKLSQEIKSRARFMIDTYPNEYDENENSSYEEAYLISRHLEWVIWEMDIDVFNNIWQKVIIEWKQFTNKKLVDTLIDVRNYVAFANDLRKQYSDTQADISTDEFNFIVSLREWIQIIEEYTINWWKMREAIIDVIEPKIEENDEKIIFNETVDKYFSNEEIN